MKRALFIKFLILLFGVIGQSQMTVETKTVKDEYGNTEQFTFYRNSSGVEIRHGKSIRKLVNETIVEEAEYKNGKFNGLQTYYYYENGRKRSEGNRFDGELTGVWTSWHRNGRKAQECSYKNSLLNGVCKYWNESGEFIEEVKYIDSKPTAFVEWEKRHAKQAFLYAHIIVRLDKFEFVSVYSDIKKEFQLSELESLIDSLPKTVWAGGRIIGIQGTGQRNQADYKRMSEIIGEINGRLRKKDFRILPMQCC